MSCVTTRLISFGIGLAVLSLVGFGMKPAIAQSNHFMTTEFNEMPIPPVDQSLRAKGVVTAIGLGLIGLELWWFLGNHASSSQK